MMTKTSIAFIALLLAWPAPVFAGWDDQFEQGKSALKAKDYTTAEDKFIGALNTIDDLADTDNRKLRTLISLAETYRRTRQWAAAAPLIERVLSAYRKEGTDKSTDAASSMSRLAIIYHRMKKFEDAEKNYLGSLEIMRKRYRQNRVNIARVVTNLAELYRQQGKTDDSIKLLKRALKDKERELGPEHPALVPSLVDLGLVHANKGAYAVAKPLIERGLKLARSMKPGEQRGKYLGSALHNLGIVQAGAGDAAAAEKSYLEAIKVRRAELGKAHPDVANSLNNLANIYAGSQREELAISHFEEALKIRVEEYGPRNSRVARTLTNMIPLLKRMGKDAKLKEAEAKLKKAQGGK